jgi:hypothetical protein
MTQTGNRPRPTGIEGVHANRERKMVRRSVVAALVGAALIAPGTALAGGWATVGLSSLPDGTRPGGTWTVDLTVLQHGLRPLTGLHPTLELARAGHGVATFPARATGRPGVYRAAVRFPAAGRYRYVVDDGFTARHRFAPVVVGGSSAPAAATPASAPGGDGSSPWLAGGVALLAGLLAAGLTRARLRRPAGVRDAPAVLDGPRA